MRKHIFRLKYVTSAVALGLGGLAAVQVADAGPGIAPVYSATAAPPPAAPDTFAQTFYANSPLGPRVDLVANPTNPINPNGPFIDTGTAMRKFVDILPGVHAFAPSTNIGMGTTGANAKYIPVAVPGKWPTDNADYYHIAVVEYTEQLHSDLPKATVLRGYVQIEEPGATSIPAGSLHIALTYPNGQGMTLPDATGTPQQVYAYDNPHYMGPLISATKDVAIRIKYSNLLPVGDASGLDPWGGTLGNGVASRNGDLPIPVDQTLAGGALPQNRIDIHMHGGLTPWISDGNPHQWTLPVGDTRYSYLSDAAVTAVGTGYMSPTLLIDPPQSIATAISAVSAAGTLSLIAVSNAGAGYTTAAPPAVTIDPPLGGSLGATANATASATLTGTSVSAIGVLAPGSGYITAPVVTIGAPPAAVISNPLATVANGAVSTVAASIQGQGYQPACTVSATTGPAIAPGCTYATVSAPKLAVAATATATVSAASGAVTLGAPSAGNFGYWSAPAVTVTPAAPPAVVPATAATTVSASTGQVTAVSLTNAAASPNFGYWAANSPTVTLLPPPAAAQASATATFNPATHAVNTTLASLAGGFGYWSANAPAVAVSAPPVQVQAVPGAAVVGNVLTVTGRGQGGGNTVYGAVTSIPLGTAGFGYWAAPTVTVAAPPAAVQAVAKPVVSATNGQLSVVMNANFGYWTAPTVTIPAPPAAANARLGAVTGIVAAGTTSANAKIAITNGGFGYWTAPAVAVTGGTHTGAAWTATATVANGRITGITFSGPGVYRTAPRVTINTNPTNGTRARATETITGGSITTIAITGGTGYDPLALPAIAVSAPVAGVTATATAQFNATTGALTGYTVTNEGSGYAATPAVSVSAPATSVAATATPVLSGGVITGLTITGGMNYIANPTITIGAPAASVTATATPVLANGTITGFTFTGGQNYATAPVPVVSAPVAGTAAVVTATVSNGVITALNLTGGTGYPAAPTIGIAAPTTSVQAYVAPVIVNGVIQSYSVVTPGIGYATAPAISLVPPPATAQAYATASIASGVVTGYTVTTAGSGYLVAPVVTVTPPPVPQQATATAVVGANGAIVGINITNPGSLYSTLVPPNVTIAPPANAIQATATVTQSAGALTSVTITNPGRGYLTTPNVQVLDGNCTTTPRKNDIPSVTTCTGGGGGGTVNALVQMPVGPGFHQVPDMAGNVDPTKVPAGYVAPITGEGTVYYTNNQTERLMWYHDHTSGTTRLNVYEGLVAPYLLTDPTVDPVLPGQAVPTVAPALQGLVPGEQIAMVLQDKTFVPKDIAQQDVNWDATHWGQYGDLWFPHVYETNQNPSFLRSLSNLGRWDWGPWFAIVYPSLYALPSGKYGDVTLTPESYEDTAVINGAAYPTLTVEPRAYRFRVLNGANDRFMNLGFYLADTSQPAAFADAQHAAGTNFTEVAQASPVGAQPGSTASYIPSTAVQAIPNVFQANATNAAFFPWPADGGAAGPGATRLTPTPGVMGPPIYSIGNEGGVLPQWVQHDPIPVNYDYNRRSATVLNLSQNNDPTQQCFPECHGLYLGPAERADFVVDFAPYAGQTLILYNDAPAPNPGFDSRIDYYTGDDPTGQLNYVTGGAPDTQPGYGPNTRTMLQVIVGTVQNASGTDPIDYTSATGTVTAMNGKTYTSWNPNALGAGKVLGVLTTNTPGPIQQLYSATQPAPIVGESAYNIAFNPTTAAVNAGKGLVTSTGGYADEFGNMYLGSQNQPEFYVTNPGPLTITSIAVTGNTTATGAASGIGLGSGSTGTNAGAGSGTSYTSPPAVVISPPTACTPPGTQSAPCLTATATAQVSGGQVVSVTLSNPGAGYTEVPSVLFVSSGGSVNAVSLTNGGSGYAAATPPAVTLSAPTGCVTGSPCTNATATATVNANGVVTGFIITSAGAGYSTAPTVTIGAPAVVAATGTATVTAGAVTAVSIVSGGSGYTTAPTVTFSAAPSGTVASITEMVNGGFGVGFTIANAGSGYTAAPTLTTACGLAATTTLNAAGGIASYVLTGIGTACTGTEAVALSTTPAVGTTAAGTAVLGATGTVASVTITTPGVGYASAPTVTFSGGTQATATAAASGGGYGAQAIAITSTTKVFIAPAAIPGNIVPPTSNAVPLSLTPAVATLLGCNAAQTSCSNLGSAVVGRLMNPAIQELFEPFYGRMNATLGIEMPNQSLTVQTTLPLNYVDPGTEMWEYNKPVMWKVTHNGVDAHPVHIHLINAQLVNRVGWDGTIKQPEDDEIGWKETIKMNPLEDIILAMIPAVPQVPFGLERSIRPQDASQPLGVNLGFTQYSVMGYSGGVGGQTVAGDTNPAFTTQHDSAYFGLGGANWGGIFGNTAPMAGYVFAPSTTAPIGVGDAATVVNSLENYDNEYVWHCHILGHEENDFMRPISVLSSPMAPPAPTTVVATQASAGAGVTVTWVDPTPIAIPTPATAPMPGASLLTFNATYGNQANEIGFLVQRSTDGGATWVNASSTPANTTTATDPVILPFGTVVQYRVLGYNVAGLGAAGTTTGSLTVQ